MPNQNPEQLARDQIDAQLKACGWEVQDKKTINFAKGNGQAVREYTTEVGPADYVLFVGGQPVGVIEAKKEDAGQNLTVAEEQTEDYAGAKLKYVKNGGPLPFLYQATGKITRFTDQRDPKPRSREVFAFHRPETLHAWLAQGRSLRARLHDLPALDAAGLRECQVAAITNLDESFTQARPRALVQMATGSGKTFTAITGIYRLLKHAKGKRVLFLVDTKNLGEQAEQEFMGFVPSDDNRKFTELYAVQRLKSSFVPADGQVCISTIQRMYAILQGKELDEAAEQENPEEARPKRKEPFPVAYNPKVPPEFFDFIVIDECHRSIYNLWRQVLEYFDAFLIGLTATPDNRTYGFFNQNVVSEYTHEKAVADGVNVGNEVYLIETQITKDGAEIKAGQPVQKREKMTRAKRWAEQGEDETYDGKQLDRDIVNASQIRTVVRTFKDKLPEIFPGRIGEDGAFEVPKTLIFAKSDSHADDIIQMVREEFNEENRFCKKITYKAEEDPKSVLSQFRNDYHPRIAVTVDMIATGTDIRPLECLLFMRDVKSKGYFEQMKGRGTRTQSEDELRKVTPSAKGAKTHFVIVDAIGVTQSIKTASPALITKPGVSLKDLALEVMHGGSDADTVSSLAARLARLDRQLTPAEHQQIEAQSGGLPLTQLVKDLFAALDGDAIEAAALKLVGQSAGDPGDDARNKAQKALVAQAAKPLNGSLIHLLADIKKQHDQTLDATNLDSVLHAGWHQNAADDAKAMVSAFAQALADHQDELDALTLYFKHPQRRHEVTLAMVRQVLETLKTKVPHLAISRVYDAYARLDAVPVSATPMTELTALVALIRRVCGLDGKISPFAETVRRNYRDWILRENAGVPFTAEQASWLEMIRDHIATSFRLEREDLELAPFDGKGGLGKMYQLFGERMEGVFLGMNRGLVV